MVGFTLMSERLKVLEAVLPPTLMLKARVEIVVAVVVLNTKGWAQASIV